MSKCQDWPHRTPISLNPDVAAQARPLERSTSLAADGVAISLKALRRLWATATLARFGALSLFSIVSNHILAASW